jgi:hypothetical protein
MFEAALMEGICADELKIGVDCPSVLITPAYEERADSRPIWCDTCHAVTMQSLTRTAEGREYRCTCGERTVYLQVARV